jgi:CII-binding regulator of phage lambda lysogenization HflD
MQKLNKMSDNERNSHHFNIDDEDSLYGDIHEAVKDAQIEQLHRELFEKEKENAALREEIDQIRLQLNHIVKEKDILEANFMTLYNTAIREMRRKDRELIGKVTSNNNQSAAGSHRTTIGQR